MHSATKFIAGHSDVMAGVLAVKGYRLSFLLLSLPLVLCLISIPVFLIVSTINSSAKQLYFLRSAEGSGLAPFDCWICLRGMKTMALHVEKQQVWFQLRL